jgi:NAD(P)H-dependent FMN reductase
VESEKVRIVGVSGGLASSSPTKALVHFVLTSAVTSLPHATDLIDVAELAPDLAFTLSRNDAVPKLEAVLRKTEGAELLGVGTPISKGSYTC